MSAALRPETEADNEAWRTRLGRRLAALTAALSTLVFVPLSLGTSSGAARFVLLGGAMVLMVGSVWLARADVPTPTRSVGVVLVFMLIGVIGYATLGFLSAPGVAFAAAVVFAGLLRGRAAIFVTIAICVVVMTAVAVLMVQGVIPTPNETDISPAQAEPWIRSVALTLIIIGILGGAVTLVVEDIEAAGQRAEREAQRRREAELQVLRAQSTQLIAQLAASLAHDVNNQLTVIGTWTDLITDESGSRDRDVARDAISQSIAQATALTKRLLVLGRQDAPVPQTIDLYDFLEDNAQLLTSTVPTDLEVVVEADTRSWCRVDPSQLAQVLLNLVVNARDAMAHTTNGRLSVEARRRPSTSAEGVEGPIPDGDWVVVSVSDTGMGMDAATASRAFEPFFTTKKVGEGTGLGLATARAVAAEAGGHIRLETAPDVGTVIELWFPEVTAGAGPDDPLVRPAVADLSDLRILLVEDAAGVREAAAHTLAGAGADVTSANDAADAILAVSEQPFDLLCSDVVMPGVSVVELIEHFESQNPGSPVLLCSGYIDEELVRRGIEDGRYQLLQKPYSPTELVGRIHSVWHSAAS